MKYFKPVTHVAVLEGLPLADPGSLRDTHFLPWNPNSFINFMQILGTLDKIMS